MTVTATTAENPKPAMTATALCGTEQVTLQAFSADEAEALDALVEDARRYGRVTADVIEMAALRHQDLEGSLSESFLNDVLHVVNMAATSANAVTLSAH